MRRAAAFDMDVVFYDPFVPNGYELALGVRRADSLAELMAQYRALDYSVLEAGKDRLLNRLANDWAQIKACLPVPFSPAPAGS